MRKRRNRRKANKNFITINKILICIVIVIGVIVTFNQYKLHKAAFSNEIVNEENNKEESSEEIKESNSNDLEKDKSVETSSDGNNDFNGVVMTNDNKGVPVLCFHSISDNSSDKNSITMPKDEFKQDLEYIKELGYTTLTLSQLSDYLFNDKPIPEKSVVLTFDDGYEDNYKNVYPILKELNMNATIFVISSYLDGNNYMTPDQVKELSDNGIDIESHTVSHKILSGLSYDEQYKELKESKDALEKLTGKEIKAIAYPEGKFNQDTKNAVLNAGYSMAFTIQRGYADRDDDQVLLNRICIDYTYKPANIKKVLENLKK